MTIFAWYRLVLANYALFRGRARRQEYWYFFLANVAIVFGFLIVAAAIQGMLGLDLDRSVADFVNLLTTVFSFAVLLPALAVSVRRLHDSGHTGWWLLLILLPPVGWLVLGLFYLLDSQPGDNRYGPNPKTYSNQFGRSLTGDPVA